MKYFTCVFCLQSVEKSDSFFTVYVRDRALSLDVICLTCHSSCFKERAGVSPGQFVSMHNHYPPPISAEQFRDFFGHDVKYFLNKECDVYLKKPK